MKKYKVSIVRIAYAFRVIEVEANDESDANDIAIEEAGNLDFSESSSEYQVDYTEEI